ncbi:hypothetical protein ACERIM_05825 [Natrinema sp. H-ect1]|uniref:hypothetical protein n=1 Tax=Natrinema sp. H-ect1 TaxID=3242700 RepID=UPI00359E6C6A
MTDSRCPNRCRSADVFGGQDDAVRRAREADRTGYFESTTYFIPTGTALLA